jgi:tetratricopeptide (TPR) repeat protein
MKLSCLIVITLMAVAGFACAKTLQEYVADGESYQKSNDIQMAVTTMQKANQEYPDSATAHAYLGYFLAVQAGQAKDLSAAGRLVQESFVELDKGVSLDSMNVRARFCRGVIGMNVPKFLGKSGNAISDLGFVTKAYEKAPERVDKDIAVTAYDFLARQYREEGQSEKARAAWEKVIEVAPGTEQAKSAEMSIAKLEPAGKTEAKPAPVKESPNITELKAKIEREPGNPVLLVELGRAYYEAGDYGEARAVFKRAVEADTMNVTAYRWLALALGQVAQQGYDERIHDDTSFRMNLVSEVADVLDKAVALAPEDMEVRYMRGSVDVSLPFFSGKFDQGVSDLETVLASDVSDSIKAEAMYVLGSAYQMKGRSYWTQVTSDYSDSPASRRALDAMKPDVKRVDYSLYKRPYVVIDFVLGFRDELAPQTAVWVEDADGKFVKTVYVSGFSGHAREKQVNLPKWSGSSKFADVDGVTAASINVGHYIYVWDMKNSSGAKVKPGKYVVKVESAYWPSMKYQLVSAEITVGKKEERKIVQEGDLIPYLEAKYVP